MYDCGFQNSFQNGIKIDCRTLEKSTRSEATTGQNLTTFIELFQYNGGISIKKELDTYDKALLTAVAWLLMLLILHSAGLRVMLVHGRSMQPTLGDGTLIISYTVKDLSDLEHGDVITVHPTPDSHAAYPSRSAPVLRATIRSAASRSVVGRPRLWA